MGYMSLNNLYKDQTVLLEDYLFALEKIHGTSARITWKGRSLSFHTGESKDTFHELFDIEKLIKLFTSHFGDSTVVVYGEDYGGKCQRNAWRYGPTRKFIAFEVQVNDVWCSVPEAHAIADYLDLEFVHYVRIPAKLSDIDAERDAISEQAIRNGVTTRDGEFIRREGVVLRPLTEKVDRHGCRVMAKHKRPEERETKTDRPVNTDKLEVLKEARAIAEEWVTETRLQHVMDKLPGGHPTDMTRTREVISAMIADVEREGKDEIVPSQQARAEIGKRTAQLLKKYLEQRLHENSP